MPSDVDTFTGIENLIGSNFADRLTGDDNDNILIGGLGNDILNGGDGNDIASYASATVAVAVTLLGGLQKTGGGGNDTLTGFEGLAGGAGADKLTGNADANVLIGNNGNDMLFGGGGGGDSFVGGMGIDTLTAGLGDDIFVFNASNEGGDIIKGFDAANDIILLTAGGFAGATVNEVNFVGSVVAGNIPPAAGGDGEGWLLYNEGTGKLYWDADGTGQAVATLLATFDTKPVLQEENFQIVSAANDMLWPV